MSSIHFTKSPATQAVIDSSQTDSASCPSFVESIRAPFSESAGESSERTWQVEKKSSYDVINQLFFEVRDNDTTRFVNQACMKSASEIKQILYKLRRSVSLLSINVQQKLLKHVARHSTRSSTEHLNDLYFDDDHLERSMEETKCAVDEFIQEPKLLKHFCDRRA